MHNNPQGYSGLNYILLSSSTLQANSTFSYLKSELEKGLKDGSKHLLVYKNLARLLAEVVYTPSTSQQQLLLDKVKNWYDLKVPSKFTEQKPSTPKPVPVHIDSNRDYPELKTIPSPSLPKKYRQSTSNDSQKSTRKGSASSIDHFKTRPSTSEPIKLGYSKRVAESPSIIRSIVNDFVRNKRVKMYNFTLQEFLTEPKLNEHKKKERPMSCSMKKQLKEVETIKNKLAYKRISCHADSLYRGIVFDDPLPENNKQLPKGGEFLLKKHR
jgi:hypothetical protein